MQLLISAYLFAVGGLVIWRGFLGRSATPIATKRLGALGAAGGVIEGIGGSWGPVVTTGLLGAGVVPRTAIGSSCVAEVAVSAAVLVALSATYATGAWGTRLETEAVVLSVLGLVAGGVPAALFGGRIAARVPKRPLSVAVGLLALAIAVQRLLSVF